MLHYYYGNGCGKTSIALGHIVRMVGRDMKPIVIQFLKKHDPSSQKGFFYGEYITLTEKLNIPVFQYGGFKFITSEKQITEEFKSVCKRGLLKAKEVLESNDYNLLILDELVTVIHLNIFTIEEVLEVLKVRSPTTEVIITGRQKIEALEDIADYATHLQEIHHPYQKGVLARPGIEY